MWTPTRNNAIAMAAAAGGMPADEVLLARAKALDPQDLGFSLEKLLGARESAQCPS